MRRLYRKPNKGLIGVDISSTSVKVLELSMKSGRYWVESYALVPLSEGSVVEKNVLNPDAVGDALARAMNLANTQSTQAAFAIPTSMAITKTIEMDADMSDDEREVQIREDAEQYIPFPLDEASIDFEVLADRLANPNRVNVLLVATRIENVEARAEVLEIAGGNPKIADVESFAIENAFRVFADTLPMGVNTVGILDIGLSTNQNLDVQLKSLEGLQEQRDAIVERMKLIQGLQTQRPIAVHLIDEIVRVTPSEMYISRFVRTGDKFTIEGKAASPNTVAELLRNLEASSWYRNAFMNSFLAVDERKDKAPSSVIPRVEASYGTFTVTVDLDQVAQPVLAEQQSSATTATQGAKS